MTDTQDERTWILTGSVMILAVVAVGVVIIYTRSVMIPFVIAVFIASLVSPVVDYQVLRLKLPRSVAVSVSLLIVLVVITVLCLFVVGAAQQVVATTGKYGDSLANLAQRLGTTLDEWGIHLDQEKIGQDIRAKIPAAATQIAGTTVNLLSNMFLVTIFVIFLLAGRNPHAIRSGIYAEIDQKIRGYIGSKVAISAVTGILVWITLSLFGLKLASVFAMFTVSAPIRSNGLISCENCTSKTRRLCVWTS
ncbi:MAG: AI-2E family transporter [Planctomycetes bacterium]|nr:AI-2E family transporter [Planctomycetota bacterium]